jgi:hypothetical protein
MRALPGEAETRRAILVATAKHAKQGREIDATSRIGGRSSDALYQYTIRYTASGAGECLGSL